MAKAIDLPIYGKGSSKSTTEESNTWEGYKGSRVREYLQAKVGATYRPDTRQDDNAYHLLSFETTQTRDEWVALYEAARESNDTTAIADLWKSELIIDDTSLGGNTDIQTSISFTILETQPGGTNQSIVNTDGSLKIRVRYTSEEYNPITDVHSDTYEFATVSIRYSDLTATNQSWSTLSTTFSIPAIATKSEYDDSTDYTEIDLTDVLDNGNYSLILTAVGQTTGMSASAQIGNVIKTNISIESATLWENANSDNIFLYYRISGNISKYLCYTITNSSGTVVADHSTSASAAVYLGTRTYVETTYELNLSATDPNLNLSHGVYTVKAWLSLDGTTASTSVVSTQIMVVKDSTSTNLLFVMNSVASSVINYIQSDIFSYAVYNPSEEETSLTIEITDYDKTTTYVSTTVNNIENNTAMTYSNALEIEDTATSIYAYIHVYDNSGNELTSGDHGVAITVDNTENFAPTANPSFVLNPRARSNSDNPSTIINAATDEEVEAIFTNFGFSTDGWVTDSNGVNVLRVPSGSEVDINYEPLSQLAGTGTKINSCTMEFDVATRNVVDEDAALLKVCTYSGTTPVGFELKPLEAVFNTATKQTKDDQDIMFQDETRTHIAVNIVYNLYGSGINYIRIFINGVINREIVYDNTETFLRSENSIYASNIDSSTGTGKLMETTQGIRIGAEGADIDIYGIRVYKRALSSAQVRQDYMASLSTASEKLAFMDANDILDDNDALSYTKCREKYNTLLWTGVMPSFSNQNKQNGDITIHIVGDPAHSGTMKDVQLKGQGTSSMTYWKWNGQFKTSYEVKNGNTTTEVKTDWVDENGTSHGAVYQLADGLPEATKLVWKINWASPQQSHKLGSVNLYTDLWKEVVGGNGITNYTDSNGNRPYENCRVSTIQKPFMLFTRETEDATPEFYALVTFGPGKADKPTFGYYKKVLPNMVMVEGCANDMPLVEHRIPWDDEVKAPADDDEDRIFTYAGEDQIEVDMGNEDMISYFKEAANFVFLHNLNITYFNGTYEQLIVSSDLDTLKQYWVTTSSADGSHSQFDLFRWNGNTSTWVNASTTKTNGSTYDALNLYTQTESTFDASEAAWETFNNTFIDWRKNHFKAYIGNYYHVNDLLYTMQFCKMVAATDNRCKNTYAYTDPVATTITKPDGTTASTYLIRFMQDDLDTIFATDNVGKKNKPYYVEEHDENSVGGTYWNGTNNVLYNTAEVAFSSELVTMMNSMLTAMSSMNGSVASCMNDYYFAVQKYFPAVAYNEVCRLLYEQAQVAYKAGTYTNNIPPIQQSLGDQLQAELEWWKKREIYISSYALYGEFAARDGVTSAGALSFRTSAPLETNYSYIFTVTPAMWLYPSFGADSSYGGTTRVKAGDSYTYYYNADTKTGIGYKQNVNVFVRGINYYSSVGNFYDISTAESFGVSGAKLTEFLAYDNSSDSSMVKEFRPSSFDITAPLLKNLNLNGISSIGNVNGLTSLTKLETLDLRGTTVTGVTVPETRTLVTVRLPETVTVLTIRNVPNLTTLTLASWGNINSLTVGENVGSAVSGDNLQTILTTCKNNGAVMGTLDLRSIDLPSVNNELLTYITSVPTLTLTGKITASGMLSAKTVMNLRSKFGDITNESNRLYVSYTKTAITTATVKAKKYFDAIESYSFDYTVNANGNNIKSLVWSISDSEYADIDASTGVLTVKKVGEESSAPQAIVTLTITTLSDETITASKTLHFYKHTLKLGDLVFADGTYSDDVDPNKTVIGVYFYSNDNIRLMVSAHHVRNTVSTSSYPWGLYSPLIRTNPDDETDLSVTLTASYDIGKIVLAGGTYGNTTYSSTLYKVATDGSAITVDTANMDSPYSPYDTPLNNVTSSGVANSTINGTTGNFITDDSATGYVTTDDDGNITGFADIESNYGLGQLGTVIAGNAYTEYNELYTDIGLTGSSYIAYGQQNTLAIIHHRNLVLSDDNVNMTIPTATLNADGTTRSELSVLVGDSSNTGLMQLAINNAGSVTNANAYRQFYYPAASLCYAYQPALTSGNSGEILADKFTAHHWWLPSLGELGRLYFYHRHSWDSESNKYIVSDDKYGIFANAYTLGVFDAFSNTSYYWSSTEAGSVDAWYVNFSSGYVYGIYNYKRNSYVVRPVCAF